MPTQDFDLTQNLKTAKNQHKTLKLQRINICYLVLVFRKIRVLFNNKKALSYLYASFNCLTVYGTLLASPSNSFVKHSI